jgi:hypothetical protein
MTNLVRGILLLLFPLAALGDVHAPHGTWIVTHHLDATELSASPVALKRYEGKALVISASSVKFARESCRVEKTHQIASDEEARAFFLHEYKADYSVLKLVAPILIVETDCNIVVTDSRNHFVFDWDGDFFEAKPPVPKKRP